MFPHKATAQYNVKIDSVSQDSKGELYLYNMQGALVAKLNQQLMAGPNSILLDAEKLLPNGVYIVHYLDNELGISLSAKIVLQ